MNDKVAFDGTIDDVTGVFVRNFELSGRLQKARRDSMVITSAIAGLFFYFGLPRLSELTRLWIALGVALLAAIGQWLHYKRRFAQRIREQMRTTYGGEGPFRFEFELTDAALVYRAFNSETTYPWDSMTGLDATPERLEFVRRKPLMVGWIPRRAFRDEAQLNAWRDFLTSKIRPSAG